MRVEGIVLAAGASSRMGQPKALLALEGKSFLDRVLESMRAGGLSRLTVVVAPGMGEIMERATAAGAGVVVNPTPQHGQLSSFQIGVEALAHDCSGAVVALVDHPAVRAATYRAVTAELERSPDGLVVPTFEGKRGHPLGIGGRWFADLRNVPEGEGARWVLHRNPGAVIELAVDDPGILLDIDTPEDLEKAGRGL